MRQRWRRRQRPAPRDIQARRHAGGRTQVGQHRVVRDRRRKGKGATRALHTICSHRDGVFARRYHTSGNQRGGGEPLYTFRSADASRNRCERPRRVGADVAHGLRDRVSSANANSVEISICKCVSGYVHITTHESVQDNETAAVCMRTCTQNCDSCACPRQRRPQWRRRRSPRRPTQSGSTGSAEAPVQLAWRSPPWWASRVDSKGVNMVSVGVRGRPATSQ